MAKSLTKEIHQKVAIATCKAWPDPMVGSLTAIKALEETGVTVSVAPWQAGHEEFADADLILPLAVWDYASDPDGFRDWLLKVKQSGGIFANRSALMAWNMNKAYLLDLQREGIHVPTTHYVTNSDQVLSAINSHGWDRVVIKPAIGQSGNGVRMLTAGEIDQLSLHQPHILQNWIPEIQQGELSMVFFEGVFSHAVRRMPAKDEWRANSQYGAIVKPASAPKSAIDAAVDCLHTLPVIPLYARVDGVMISEDFLLTELELIEPALFFEFAPSAAMRFATVIRNLIGSHPSGNRSHRI